LLRYVLDWARRANPRQRLAACWAGTLLSDFTSIHFYVSPTREPEEARRTIESAASYGPPVVATEALGRPDHGEVHEVLPLFARHGIGWYLWELMIGADPTRYQWPGEPPPDARGFQRPLYAHGTPYRVDETELIRGQAG